MNNASRDIVKITKEGKKKTIEVFKNKRILVVILVLVIIVVAMAIMSRFNSRKKVMTVADTSFYTDDYMIYLKLAKDDYFGKEIGKIPEATLNTIVDQNTNTTVENYLKQKTEGNLKIAGIISKIAKENNITLSDENKKQISEEKENLINKLGGKKQFKQWLKNNRTTEEAYDKMSQTEKLYSVIFDNLYAEGKANDLTEEEKENAKNTYKRDYKKIKQIVLFTVNPQDMKELSEKEKEQKKLLADTIYAELKKQKNYNDFNKYIKKYSDNSSEDESSYVTYFKSGQLLKDIEKAADKLKAGEISEVIESQYAYHIILREELDDSYLEKIYKDAREQKLLTDISEEINKTGIIIENTLEKMSIN